MIFPPSSPSPILASHVTQHYAHTLATLPSNSLLLIYQNNDQPNPHTYQPTTKPLPIHRYIYPSPLHNAIHSYSFHLVTHTYSYYLNNNRLNLITSIQFNFSNTTKFRCSHFPLFYSSHFFNRHWILNSVIKLFLTIRSRSKQYKLIDIKVNIKFLLSCA